MPLIVARQDLKPEQIIRTRLGTKTTLFTASRDNPDVPTAFVGQYNPGGQFSAHFHAVDQFQIIIDGQGRFGRHDVGPYYVHFARAYTPYGPLLANAQTGWSFLSLCSHYDAGGQDLETGHDKLKQMPGRRPWQASNTIAFPAPGAGASLHDVTEIKDDGGLYVLALTMAPNTKTAAPDPAGGDGQFVVVFKGSLVSENQEHLALTVVFVKPGEPAFEIHAGARGLEGLILNLPRIAPVTTARKMLRSGTGHKTWQCLLCAFAYDEAVGLPEEGIAAGTRWEDVPATWTCPDCSASKSDFERVET